LFSCFMWMFSSSIISTLYGEDYIQAGKILSTLSFHTVAVTFMLINIRWFIAEDLNRIVMLKMIGAVLLNTLLNFILIPFYGLTGAAVSTILTHILFLYIIDVFFDKTRKAFFINSSFLTFRN